MVTHFTLDLFKDPFFIGFNDMFDRLNSVHTTASHQSYPPYNIVKVEDDVFRVDLALAGFDKKDVDVSVDNGTLVIKGEVSVEDSGEAIHKGTGESQTMRVATRGYT